MTVQSNAEAFIDVVIAHGVREIFFNPGGGVHRASVARRPLQDRRRRSPAARALPG